MTERVGVEFQGTAVGAVAAAKATQAAIAGVKTASVEATAATNQLGSASGRAATSHAHQSKELGNIEKEARGGIASFTGLGRAMFFASNAFLGGVLIGGTLKAIITQARDAQVAMTRLGVVVTNTGASWAANRAQVEAYIKTLSHLSAFSSTDLATSLSKLILATGSLEKGQAALKIATNLARAANEDLATATTQVAMAETGRLTTIRGLGISVPKVTTASDALKEKLKELKAAHMQATDASIKQAQAAAKLSDANSTAAKMMDVLKAKTEGADAAFAKTSAGHLAAFHNSLHDLELSIGTALLPEIDTLVKKLTRWMDQLNKTGQAQRDVKEGISVLKDVVKTAGDVIHTVDGITGSFKHTLELLLGLKVASVLSGWVFGFKNLAGAAKVAAGEAGVGGLVGSFKKLGGVAVLGPLGLVVAGIAAITYAAYEAAKAIQKIADAYGLNGGGSISTLAQYRAMQKSDPALAAALLKKDPNIVAQLTGAAAAGNAATTSRGITSTAKKELAYATRYGPGSGITYNWGGVSPLTGFDCSGYLMAAYAAAGVPIPRDTRGQWNDPNAIRVLPGGEQPGDGVYFVGSTSGANAGPPPGHVGIYIGGGQYISYYSQGKPAATGNLANAGDYMGARRWLKISDTKGASSPPPKTGTPGLVTHAIPPKVHGTSAQTITSLLGSVAATALKAVNAPGPLDDAEKSIIARMRRLADAVTIHTTPEQLAKTRVELAKLSTSLTAEMHKVAAKIKAAAAEQKKDLADAAAAVRLQFDQAWSLMTTKINRTIAESWASTQQTYDRETSSKLTEMQRAFATKMKAFDAATQAGLQGLVVAQTPAEKALADFIAGRSATALAKQKTDLLAQIADTKAQLAALGVDTTGGGATIDIATGTRTPLTPAQSAIVSQQKTLTDQLMSQQDQWNQLMLDDQQTALQAQADASRVAADKQTTADQQAYQDQRDALKQSLTDAETVLEQSYSDKRAAQWQANQDLHDDQVAAFDQELADLQTSIDKKTKRYSDFLAWYAAQTLGQPATPPISDAGLLGGPTYTGGARGTIVGGHAIYGFAAGGKVPGRFIGREDTILARLTPGEVVLPRAVVAALENAGGGGHQTIHVPVYLDGRKIAEATVRPMDAALRREIGYTNQQG